MDKIIASRVLSALSLSYRSTRPLPPMKPSSEIQAEAAVRERLAVVSRERTAAVMELDASRVLVDSLKVSLVQTQSIADAAQAEARDAREKAAAAIEGVQTEAASAAEAAAERHKVIRCLLYLFISFVSCSFYL